MTLDEVKALTKDDLLDEIGIPVSPARLKCALLGLKVLKAGIYGVPQDDDVGRSLATVSRDAVQLTRTADAMR